MALIKKGIEPKDTNIKQMISEGSPIESTESMKDLKSIQANGSDLARHLKEDAFNITESVIAEGKNRLAGFQSYASQQLKTLEQEIVANPAKSMAIAVGAGALLSFLLSRR